VRAPLRVAGKAPPPPVAEDEEVFAEHGMHLGTPLQRAPRERTSVLKTATISSALKHPSAMRDMLPAAAPPAARLAAAPEAALAADVAGVVLVSVTAVVESSEALADRAAAAAAAAAGSVDAYGDADEYEEEEEEPETEDDAEPEDAAGASAIAEGDEGDDDAFDDGGDDAPADAEDADADAEDGGAASGVPRHSVASTAAVEGALEDLLLEGFETEAEGDDVADAPEEADAAAIAAGDAFLDVLEAMLDDE
jgi:hypothetical protein